MAGEDLAYVAAVRAQRCLMWGRGCSGRTEAHHAGERAMSKRAHDDTCLPLCTQHHRDWHAAAGPFRQMGQEARRAWAVERIAEMQKRLGPL